MKFVIPENYVQVLGVRETQLAIKYIMDSFPKVLSEILNLTRISASLLVPTDSGFNDNLSGSERPVRFNVPSLGKSVEVVHSLAKWKRVALQKYGFNVGEGIYTEMNAIRRDEELSNFHSIYVDQWDWERIITKEQRSMETLIQTAKNIYEICKQVSNELADRFPGLRREMPNKLKIISVQELINKYPSSTEKEREDAICREYGAVLLTQIGNDLPNGIQHGSRAPDYDDWSMNGDLLLYYPVLDCSIEISSMGVRVDSKALVEQTKISKKINTLKLPYHQAIINDELPFTVGGGIGQSRIYMYMLNKAHIGEVQASIWPEEMIKNFENEGIYLL